MRRWVMITSMNKKLNNPTRQHHHPQYHPLRMLPNSAILDCNVMNSSEEKWYVVPQRLENINFCISVVKVEFIDKMETTAIVTFHCIFFCRFMDPNTDSSAKSTGRK